MNVNAELKERMMQVGTLVDTVEIDKEFWDLNQPYWQNTNNHTLLMLRNTYHRVETDEEIHKVLGPLVDKMAWVFVSYPELRARISWLTWFFQLYAFDKQFAKEKYTHEVWTDPRKWGLATDTVNPLEVVVEVNDDSASGLATQGTH